MLGIIQFSSYLFTCERNSPKANCRVSTSKERETRTKCYKQNNKYRAYIIIIIIIIIIVTVIMVIITVLITCEFSMFRILQ
jgi:t-SNARE complex subunit (syntaxin)